MTRSAKKPRSEYRVAIPDGLGPEGQTRYLQVLLSPDQYKRLYVGAKAHIVAKHSVDAVEAPSTVSVVANGRLFEAEPVWVEDGRVYVIRESVGRPRTGNRRGPDGRVGFTLDELMEARQVMEGSDWSLDDMAALWDKDPRTVHKAFEDRPGHGDAEAERRFHYSGEIPPALAAKFARGPMAASISDPNDGSLDP